MLEPSNPMPSEKSDSVSSPTGMLKCCQLPSRSAKRRSTILIPNSRALRMTSAGLALVVMVGDIAGGTSFMTLTAKDSSIAIGLLPRTLADSPPPPIGPLGRRGTLRDQIRVLAGSGLWSRRPMISRDGLCAVHKPKRRDVAQGATGGLMFATWDRARALSLK